MAICNKCQDCRREKLDQIEQFKEKFVDGGIVEKGPQCQACDNVEGDNLELCIVCGETIRKN